MELLYAGMFTLHVPEEHRSAILLIECPRLLFPFARNIVADVTRDGGFPPVMLGIVDFVQMYQNRAKAEQASATEKTE
jgi:preprotein translocase subunit SecB